jgi:L-lactate dehydrogenase complex protein LldG
MNSKNEILDRLRKKGIPEKEYQLSQWDDEELYADYPKSSDSLLEIFNQQLNKLSGELYIANNTEEAVKILQEKLENLKPEKCKAHQSPLIEKLKFQSKEIEKFLTVIDGENIPSEEYAEIDVGITQADYLIARTGSILIRTISAGGRRLSVLPPTHIVIAEEKQLVPSLDDALQKLDYGEDYWSYATMITGPSRTSDIEKQLVLGAHGPKRLIVILIKDQKI